MKLSVAIAGAIFLLASLTACIGDWASEEVDELIEDAQEDVFGTPTPQSMEPGGKGGSGVGATDTSVSFASVDAGHGHHACGVKRDGSISCWGGNSEGQATPPAGEFASVSAGGEQTCGVKTDGPIVCWGEDHYGEATPPAGEFVSVSAGAEHTCGVKMDGSVACWGFDSSGEATPPAGGVRHRQRRVIPRLRGKDGRLYRLLGKR